MIPHSFTVLRKRLAVAMWRLPEGSSRGGQALQAEMSVLEEKKLWRFQSKADSRKNTSPQSGQMSEKRWHTQHKGTPGSFVSPKCCCRKR